MRYSFLSRASVGVSLLWQVSFQLAYFSVTTTQHIVSYPLMDSLNTLYLLNPKSDQHLIFPYDITLDQKTNSPREHVRKCIMNSMENMHNEIRV